MAKPLTLGSFKTHLLDANYEVDGLTDYARISQSAKEYFGHAIPNAQIWKVLNSIGKPKAVEVIDDL